MRRAWLVIFLLPLLCFADIHKQAQELIFGFEKAPGFDDKKCPNIAILGHFLSSNRGSFLFAKNQFLSLFVYTHSEKKRLFNEALFSYLQQEKEHPSWQLEYNIANTFVQLGEYGYATLYYYRALKEVPRNKSVQANLQVALQKAGLPPESFGSLLSDNEKFFTILILFFVLFVYGVIRNSWRGPLCGVVTVCILSILASLVWQEYIAFPKAVIVTSIAPRIGPAYDFGLLPGVVGIAGKRVEVLECPKGSWLHVRFSSGEKGYIPIESALLI